MASLDDLKKRIASVKSTQKITKAMKMVAAAKLRRAQESAKRWREGQPLGLLDGIPWNIVYDINCDEEWVWFLTNKGVAFYNWSRYTIKIHRNK